MKKSARCPHCGKLFKSDRPTQTYCSLECAESVIARQSEMEARLAPVSALSDQDFLTFSKAAVLMGCSRQYVYKLVAEGRLQASRLSSRMSFIKKSDIDAMLQSNPYHRVLPLGMSEKRMSEDKAQSIAEQTAGAIAQGYITLDEAVKMYKVGSTCIYNKVKDNGVSVCRISGKNYYNKAELDDIFPVNTTPDVPTEFLEDTPGIEWIAVKDAATLYNKSMSAMMMFVSRYDIPTRWIEKRKYYSKTHIDRKLGKQDIDTSDYYSISQMYNVFGMSREAIPGFIKANNIPITRVVRKLYLRKQDVDAAFSHISAKTGVERPSGSISKKK